MCITVTTIILVNGIFFFSDGDYLPKQETKRKRRKDTRSRKDRRENKKKRMQSNETDGVGIEVFT